MKKTAPIARRERRAAQRAERASQPRPALRARRRRPAWQSPMFLFTTGALVVGALIAGLAFAGQGPSVPPAIDDLARPRTTVPAELADGRSLGRSDAPVTIEIWSDFQCPACRMLAEDIEPRLVAEYVVPGTVRLVYRDAAFQGTRAGNSYDESVEAAAGARCAADQNLFWQMHNWIFANWNGENEGAFRAERLRAMAAAAGVDLDSYAACLATGDEQAAVRAETAQGVAAGISSTPTLIINGQSMTGVPRYDALAALIDGIAP